MTTRTLILGAAAALSLALGASAAHAQGEGEIIRMHDACRAGDHEACARFDQAIHDRQHEDEWRHNHPEWYR
jgi:DNA-binding GntR family transcriptional regulator